jgi:hypothetical protein
MISELNDDEILDFLMTSEFENDFSPSDLKYMLRKYRYFYRILHGKLERANSDKEFEKNVLIEEIKSLKDSVTNTQIQKARAEDEVCILKSRISSRKLTWKERIKGKITIEDEDKRVQ